MQELSYDLVALIEVREDLFVGVCMIGLTLIVLVIVKIWREISLSGEFSRNLNGGNDMECQGRVVWSCNFRKCWV